MYRSPALKYFFALAFLFLFVAVAFSQSKSDKKIDSLLAALKTIEARPSSFTNDTSRIRNLNVLCRQWIRAHDYAKALACAENALAISDALMAKVDFEDLPAVTRQKLRDLESFSLFNVGNAHNERSETSQALGYYRKAARIYEDRGERCLALSNIYFSIAMLYFKKADFNESLEFHLKALKIREALGNKKAIASSYHSMGNLYEDDRALDFYFKSLKIKRELGDSVGVANLYNNIGLMYGIKGDRIKNRIYMYRSLAMKEALGDIVGVAATYINVAEFERERADSALKRGNKALHDSCFKREEAYVFKALKAHEYANNTNGVANVYNEIGSLKTEEGKYAEAKEWFDKSLELSTRIGAKSLLESTYARLSELYKTQAELPQTPAAKKLEYLKKALEYKDLVSVSKDSIYNQESIKAMADMQTRYDTEKKDNEIMLLNKDKETQKAESEKQRAVLWSVAGGFLLVVVFSGFIFRSLRIAKKQKRIIEMQKTEAEKAKQIIEEKNKDITDSITYALKIQQARLPHVEEIKQVFPDSFVLFRPKDIVSGDFYYFHKNEMYTYIAAADCTGHGVPGAFMSMIGSERLDDAMMHKKEPSGILSYLNTAIKASLKQTGIGDSMHDGMDIALCAVDVKKREVKYAGANRPLWLVRKGSSGIVEIKPNKSAIGGFTSNEQVFDTHSITLGEGDTFYIFSDGYADAFGGERRKKLTTKRFKELLLSNSHRTMEEQGQLLGSFMDEWSGATEQIDDILVMGIRL